MEAAVIRSVIGVVVMKLHKMIEEDSMLRYDLKKLLRYMKKEMQMMNDAIITYGKSKDHWLWILELQELAYDMEDCLDIFEEKAACEAGMPWYRRRLHQFKTVDIRTQFARELTDLKQRALEASGRRDRYISTNTLSAPEPDTSSNSTSYTPEAELVGITKPKEVLLKLLWEKERPRRVISILGPRGIGKTTLARAIYDDADIKNRFPWRAWVVASEHRGDKELLKEIVRQVEAPSSSSDVDHGENLNKHLQVKSRYLIVIDDVQTSLLDTIRPYLPDNGRIIVTTSMQSIANTCSTNTSYIYRMEALSDDDSKALLFKIVLGDVTKSPSLHLEEGSKSILRKCEGLPLGIVNIANYLKEQGSEKITNTSCDKMCRNLGSHMHSNGALGRMKQVLIHSYDNLPGHDLKNCLLSVSIYPKDQPIKRKRLVRRWLAEGFVVKVVNRKDEDVACEHFDSLINRSIIQPVEISNSVGVSTCRLHGIMLDFIVHKSASENFITLIHNDEIITNANYDCAIRRLSLHKLTEEGGRAVMGIDISRIRSLTIFGHTSQALVDFHKSKLLRVLDLENCKELRDCDLDSICTLLQLKYLNLRGTGVSKLPKEISKLLHLETLDIRDTRVNMLPKEVLSLPELTHLFGKFKLPCELGITATRASSQTRTIFSGDSKLETLAGFVLGETHFQQIILNMKKLRKVKVLAESTPSSDIIGHLVSSFKKRLISSNPLDSLSVDFGDHSIDFLDTLDASGCSLTSIKLHGCLTSLPIFITSLLGLSKLHLVSTGLDSSILSTLQELHLLICLKLVENRLEFGNGSFTVEKKGFQSLQRLYIQAKKLPKFNIAKGAMQHLYSLQLISEDISGVHEDTVKHLKGLKEVTLDHSVGDDTRKSWEAELKQHKNRPLLWIKTDA
ncbi:disease resistance protein RGA4-like [Hordeum vulgare subsp. vulgare]|uniref:NB-ARC domain-containing protein n=1 Tax=Hordeum vulgare subsp. vulgare TaxID=112509 RepID=A0A8I7BK36_HORVV|nr:disease resistance protein RGA4-like [Hordeum vulgare subsp. vulgare]